MAHQPLRVGLIGAGANTKLRHIPGLRAIADVQIVAICNRRPESTAAVAKEFGIPRTFDRWQDLLASTEINAVVVGTWPYLHCPIVLEAFQRGKHVLTEARMSMNAAEAHSMLAAALKHPKLVTQIVPSPFGLKGHRMMREMIDAGYLGELREASVGGINAALADPASPLSWRQDAGLSGFNMLTLGIIHETFLRWARPPIRVMAQVHAHIPSRVDPQSGVLRPVGTPDSVQILAVLEGGARATYHFSGVAPVGQNSWIHLYGSEGVLHYDLLADRIFGANKASARKGLEEIAIPKEKEGGWRVEAEFIDAIRGGKAIEFTDFATGVRYMEFTEAVARSAELREPIDLPLEEFGLGEAVTV